MTAVKCPTLLNIRTNKTEKKMEKNQGSEEGNNAKVVMMGIL